MSDIELVRKCAEMMGMYGASEIRPLNNGTAVSFYLHGKGGNIEYNPLTDDAQAMALVKRFKLSISYQEWSEGMTWVVSQDGKDIEADKDSLNRAIVEAVAKMKAAE